MNESLVQATSLNESLRSPYNTGFAIGVNIPNRSDRVYPTETMTLRSGKISGTNS